MDGLGSPAPERLVVERGRRSGQVIAVSVDSTRLGPALGGCRALAYPAWQDGVADAVRLSAAMTEKAALAGLAHGGGKTVVVLEPGFTGPRADLLADVGDAVEAFGGDYVTGPDVGTGPADMVGIGRRTRHVLCRPEAEGGSGDSSAPTALGVGAAIDAVRARLWPGRELGSLSFAVHGLGHVGSLVARSLAAAGARLVVSDVDTSRRALAESLGADWVSPQEALVADVDVLAPCAVGGVLTAGIVGELRCAAVVGAANNQLDHDGTADLLHARGVLWAPDPVVSGGGVIASVAREREGASAREAQERVRGIGARLGRILDAATASGTTPLHETRRLVRELLDAA
ncbi:MULTISPECIES: Glu/Leu/Phe/Val dehydrogenase dimerization domain-containing protein [Actinosynnema]|uniref:Glu/Leu/Phe/Val dehydrogenase dimerization domain-containing protein n=1 Tax=Actinosynnema TaxID=40566 RepID=UPI0020A34EFB|nr:Glu/Leu/Phe/Val dehydrogenase dimerization domain-containing protein [Actinosynnema pretiosum]MCP2094537.1 leucine dehydrogenase [Actinosynnema pretiosum]